MNLGYMQTDPREQLARVHTFCIKKLQGDEEIDVGADDEHPGATPGMGAERALNGFGVERTPDRLDRAERHRVGGRRETSPDGRRPPGGVEDEQRYTPRNGVRYGVALSTGRAMSCARLAAPPLMSPPMRLVFACSKSPGVMT